jgi:hypothetical protein
VDNLQNQFIKALQDAIGVSSNSYLHFLNGAVEEVSKSAQVDQVLLDYNKSLLDIVANRDFALDAERTNEFSQVLGEAHFYLLCKNKGVLLTRIKEGKDKTPDFKIEHNDMHLEVKTISVVSGSMGIKQSLEDSLDAQVEVENQLNKGEKVAFGETVIQPYGDKQYKDGKGPISTVIETLIDKSGQNIKSGQFPNNKSFLVLNLSIIPPFRTENYVLRPAYCDDYMFNKSVSGELWMMAFTELGAPILSSPEFKGKPCVESIASKVGILSDPNFDMVSGILFMIHPWQRPSEIWGLYNHDKVVSWRDNEPNIFETLLSITENNWNDSRDSNGWKLQG